MYIELELFITRNFLMPFQFKKKKVKKKFKAIDLIAKKTTTPEHNLIYISYMYDTAVIVKTYN